MKAYLYIWLVIVMMIPAKSQAQTKDVHSFLLRFKSFSTAHAPKVKSYMPLVNPGSNLSKMPNAVDPAKAYMEDIETGLRVFPQSGKLFDPKTGYSIYYEPDKIYHVDLKAGKIYQNQAEVKVEQNVRKD